MTCGSSTTQYTGDFYNSNNGFLRIVSGKWKLDIKKMKWNQSFTLTETTHSQEQSTETPCPAGPWGDVYIHMANANFVSMQTANGRIEAIGDFNVQICDGYFRLTARSNTTIGVWYNGTNSGAVEVGGTPATFTSGATYLAKSTNANWQLPDPGQPTARREYGEVALTACQEFVLAIYNNAGTARLLGTDNTAAFGQLWRRCTASNCGACPPCASCLTATLPAAADVTISGVTKTLIDEGDGQLDLLDEATGDYYYIYCGGGKWFLGVDRGDGMTFETYRLDPPYPEPECGPFGTFARQYAAGSALVEEAAP
jgi:hypothetical protein